MASITRTASASGRRHRLHTVDLNLLPALEALLEEANVSRAARRIGLSQSALSHALARLRAQYNDELLVRSGGGMVRTPLAAQLHAQLRGVLDHVDKLVGRSEPFVPAHHAAHVRIRAPVTMPWLARLHALLRAQAPRVTLQVIAPARASSDDLVRELADGHVDLSFMARPVVPPGLVVEPLPDEPYRVVTRGVRRGGPSRLTLKRFVALPHVLVSHYGRATGLVDDALRAIGQRRHVAVIVPTYAQAAELVAASEMVATVPATVAEYLAENHGLRAHAPPLPLPPIQLNMVWHARTADDPAARWFRSLVIESLPRLIRPALP